MNQKKLTTIDDITKFVASHDIYVIESLLEDLCDHNHFHCNSCLIHRLNIKHKILDQSECLISSFENIKFFKEKCISLAREEKINSIINVQLR